MFAFGAGAGWADYGTRYIDSTYQAIDTGGAMTTISGWAAVPVADAVVFAAPRTGMEHVRLFGDMLSQTVKTTAFAGVRTDAVNYYADEVQKACSRGLV